MSIQVNRFLIAKNYTNLKLRTPRYKTEGDFEMIYTLERVKRLYRVGGCMLICRNVLCRKR